jgi:hypothetical protein
MKCVDINCNPKSTHQTDTYFYLCNAFKKGRMMKNMWYAVLLTGIVAAGSNFVALKSFRRPVSLLQFP